MFNLTECHFIYNDINSRTYNLVFAHIDSEEFAPISGVKESAYVFNKATKSRHIISDRFDDSPLFLDVEIVRCNGETLSNTEIREIERWLFANSKYKKLYIDPVDDPSGETYEISNGKQVYTYLNCRFMNGEKIFGNGGVIGFRCTIETDSYLAWQDETIENYYVNAPENIVYQGEQVHILLGDPLGDGEIGVDDSEFALDYYTEYVLGGKTRDQVKTFLANKYQLDEVTDEQLIACVLNFNPADYEAVKNGQKEPGITAQDPENILKIYVDNLVGITHTDSYIDPETGQRVYDYSSHTISVNVDSDVDGYTYPVVKIRTGSIGGQIEITNLSERVWPYTMMSYRHFILKDTTPNTEYIIDSTITGYSPFNADIKTAEFLRLINGKNNVYFGGNIREITITWNNRRFL